MNVIELEDRSQVCDKCKEDYAWFKVVLEADETTAGKRLAANFCPHCVVQFLVALHNGELYEGGMV